MSSNVFGLFTRRAACAAVALIALLASAPTRAEVVFGNLGASGTTPLAPATASPVTVTTWLAHGFTVGGTNNVLSTVSLGLADTDNDTARVRLFSDVGGSPSGLALATLTQSVPSASPTLYNFNFNQTLTSGSSYWIVVDAPDAGGFLNWQFNNEGDFPGAYNSSGWAPLNPVTKISTDSGAIWATSNVNRPASISITAVPEPSTLVLAGIGLTAIAGLEFRRRVRRSGSRHTA